jgi:ketosteroid isomerase-like protein
MHADHEGLVLASIEAYNQGDIEAVVALVTEDMDLRPPSHLVDGVVFRGHAGVRSWAARAAEMWSSASSTAHVVEAAGNRLVVAMDYELVGRDSGVPVSQRTYTLYRFRDGRIAAAIAYPSEAEALAALGGASAGEELP